VRVAPYLGLLYVLTQYSTVRTVVGGLGPLALSGGGSQNALVLPLNAIPNFSGVGMPGFFTCEVSLFLVLFFQVPAARVTKKSELRAALQKMLDSPDHYLLDIIVPHQASQMPL